MYSQGRKPTKMTASLTSVALQLSASLSEILGKVTASLSDSFCVTTLLLLLFSASSKQTHHCPCKLQINALNGTWNSMNSVFSALNVLNGTVHAMLNNVLNALNLLNGTMHATFSQYGNMVKL